MTVEEKIEEIKEFLKDKTQLIIIGGSRSIPFIHNPKDWDVVVICEDRFKLKEASDWFDSKYNRDDLKTEYKIDIYFRTMEQHLGAKGIIYAYFLHWCDPEHAIELNEEEIKQSIKNRCDRFEELKVKDPHLSMYDSKFWYYIYTVKCLLENNSYELTEEQIENVNILHDRKEEDFEVRKSLIDNLEEEIMLWQV